MAYILNKLLSDKKKCVIALTEIDGLGVNLNYQICDQLGISEEMKCKHLSAAHMDKLTRCISQNYLTGADLKDAVKKRMENSIHINSYKGFRYIEKLPCRGQRTHGNAQTVRRQSVFFPSLSRPLLTKEKKWAGKKKNLLKR